MPALNDLPVPMLVARDAAVVDVNKLLLELAPWPVTVEGAPLEHLFEGDAAGALDEAASTGTTCLLTLRGDARMRFAGWASRRGRDLLVALSASRDEVMANRIIDRLADSTIVIGRDGLVSWQSQRLRARIPAGPSDGLGINPMERIHPDDLPALLDSFGRALDQDGLRERSEVRSRAPEDDDRWQVIEVEGVSAVDDRILSGVIVQVRNLDQAETTASLDRAEPAYNSLAEAAPIGIVVDDRNGDTVYRNATAQELLGQRGLHRGEPWSARIEPAYRHEVHAMVRGAVERGVVGDTRAAFEVDGTRRWLRVRVAPRVAGGESPERVSGVIVTLFDVTTEVEARAHADRLTHMLDATTDLVAVVQRGGGLLYANEATRAALDSLEARGGEGIMRELIVEDDREVALGRMVETLEAEGQWHGELLLDLGRAAPVPHSAVVVAHRDIDGGIDWFAMVGRDISELKAAEQRLRQLATRDGLTGLANRSLANDRLGQAVARSRRSGVGLAVLFCDLDGFKEINDRYGHAGGDQVLVEVAARLAAVVRASDTVARVGGDEFVVICEGITERERLAELAQRVIDVVTAPVRLPGVGPAGVGISVGVAVAESVDVTGEGEAAHDADRLLTVADGAMYRAKARGGNGFRIVRAERA